MPDHCTRGGGGQETRSLRVRVGKGPGGPGSVLAYLAGGTRNQHLLMLFGLSAEPGPPETPGTLLEHQPKTKLESCPTHTNQLHQTLKFVPTRQTWTQPPHSKTTTVSTLAAAIRVYWQRAQPKPNPRNQLQTHMPPNPHKASPGNLNLKSPPTQGAKTQARTRRAPTSIRPTSRSLTWREPTSDSGSEGVA